MTALSGYIEGRAVLSETSTMTLSDGRTLGFAEYGTSEGLPVFFFHGLPGSRVQGAALANAAKEHGFQIIAPDRPGMGYSTYQSDRSILDWADDVRELADHLGFRSFAVIGVSGGSPYAAACAIRNPKRVTHLTNVSGVAPNLGITAQHTTYGFLGRLGRALTSISTRGFFEIQRVLAQRFPERLFSMMPGGNDSPDARILSNPEIASLVLRDLLEAFRISGKGASKELTLLREPWGFELGDIPVDVHIWHGAQDNNVPMAAAYVWASSVRYPEEIYLRDEGHISLLINHAAEILEGIR